MSDVVRDADGILDWPAAAERARKERQGKQRSIVDLDRLVRDVPSGLAAVVIELSTGMPLQVSSIDRHAPADFHLLAAAASELFQDSTVTAIERMDLDHQESAEERRKALKQIIVQSNHLHYIFLRSHKDPDLVLATLCRADANLGLALVTARDSLRELESEG